MLARILENNHWRENPMPCWISARLSAAERCNCPVATDRLIARRASDFKRRDPALQCKASLATAQAPTLSVTSRIGRGAGRLSAGLPWAQRAATAPTRRSATADDQPLLRSPASAWRQNQ